MWIWVKLFYRKTSSKFLEEEFFQSLAIAILGKFLTTFWKPFSMRSSLRLLSRMV
ncbi:MAG: hypothetical protein RMI93_02280 [Caldimicrobium sp.]|nr:hypothetical protein [Caldimicrobium sp.]MDW8182419.1 hypothetical protein [Caldimicrobium sp.]